MRTTVVERTRLIHYFITLWVCIKKYNRSLHCNTKNRLKQTFSHWPYQNFKGNPNLTLKKQSELKKAETTLKTCAIPSGWVLQSFTPPPQKKNTNGV